MLIRKFDDAWKYYIWSYVNATKNKEDIFTICLNYCFEWETIQRELDYIPLKKLNILRRERQKVLDNNDPDYIGQVAKHLASNPRVHRIENPYFELYEIEGFLTSEDCDKFLEYIRNSNIFPSTVTNPDVAVEKVRTSKTCFMNRNDSLVANFNNQLHDFMKLPMDEVWDLQGQVYDEGEEFKPHTDFFGVGLNYDVKNIANGQRTWTFMLYLNNVEEGGDTIFTKINFNCKPKKGKALLWNNLGQNGMGNPWTEHWGSPVIKGQKNIITKWFREVNANSKPGFPMIPEVPG
jgi:prolyl 4-hydroxylase